MSSTRDHEFANREEWRKWLQTHHRHDKEVWVVIHKKKSEQQGLRYPEAVEEAICFGWIDSKMQSIDAQKFRQRFSPRRKNSLWSQNNRERAEQMLHAGKMTQAGLTTIQKAQQTGHWETAYSSKQASPIPPDLVNALQKNTAAWTNFQLFSNSVKFQYIHWVQSAKKAETRRNRIRMVVDKSANNIKPS